MMQNMQIERDDKNTQVKAVAIFLVILGGHRIILYIYQQNILFLLRHK